MKTSQSSGTFTAKFELLCKISFSPFRRKSEIVNIDTNKLLKNLTINSFSPKLCPAFLKILIIFIINEQN